jgi:predicted transcriptional regulator of viral defense system
MLRKDALDTLLELASEQGGYVTTAQAGRLSLVRDDLFRLVKSGDLTRVRRGVYRMRHAQLQHEDEIAAWLALERGNLPWERKDEPLAVISHESAAAMHGLGTIIPMRPTLTLRPHARRYPNAGDLVVHRAPLGVDDWTWFDNGALKMPVTTPARTIIDLLLDKQEPSYVARATREALSTQLLTPDELMASARRRKSQTASLQARTAALLDSAA